MFGILEEEVFISLTGIFTVMSSKRYYRRVRVVWIVISSLVVLSMILFLIVPFFGY